MLCVFSYHLWLEDVTSIYLQLWRELPFVFISIVAGLSTCVLAKALQQISGVLGDIFHYRGFKEKYCVSYLLCIIYIYI